MTHFPLYDEMLHLVDGIVATGEYAFDGGAKIDDNVIGSNSDRESSIADKALQPKVFGGSSSQNTSLVGTDTDNVCSIYSLLLGN